MTFSGVEKQKLNIPASSRDSNGLRCICLIFFFIISTPNMRLVINSASSASIPQIMWKSHCKMQQSNEIKRGNWCNKYKVTFRSGFINTFSCPHLSFTIAVNSLKSLITINFYLYLLKWLISYQKVTKIDSVVYNLTKLLKQIQLSMNRSKSQN